MCFVFVIPDLATVVVLLQGGEFHSMRFGTVEAMAWKRTANLEPMGM